MKINIQIPANSKRTRILAAFMAFLIFALTFQQAFVGWEFGVRVSAANYGTDVYTGVSSSAFMTAGTASTEDSRYVYSGKMKTNDVTLFDYVSDNERESKAIDLGEGTGGYHDPYYAFNDAISQSSSSIKHQASGNITIYFKPSASSGITSDVHVYMSGSGSNNGWPGKRMIYDSVNERYTYTFNRTDSSSPYYLNFTPTWFQFNDGTNTHETAGISYTMSTNHTYSVGERIIIKFRDEVNKVNDANVVKVKFFNATNQTGLLDMTYDGKDSNNHKWFSYDATDLNFIPTDADFYINNNSGWHMNGGNTTLPSWISGVVYKAYYYSNNNSIDKVSIVASSDIYVYETSGQPIYQSAYTNPLYFGMFYKGNGSGSYSDSNAKDPGYNNFHWLTNMGLKNRNGVTGDSPAESNVDGYKYRGSAAVQGLVEDKLTKDSDTSTATPEGKLRQGTTELPFFSTAWATAHPTLLRYYDHNATDSKIAFPFYEVRTPISGANANTDVVLKDSVNAPAQSGDYAKYYQFSSKDTNLYFQKVGNDSDHAGYFRESDVTVHNGTNSGFFPFNNTDAGDAKNLGFGTKYEMQFTLQPDGCVGVIDANGEDRDSTLYPERVHTTFEFQGDDDLWVFIDGKLVLDMGGDHYNAKGKIDFATGIATVDKAVTYSTGDPNDLGNHPDISNDLSVDIELNKEYNFKTGIAGYDPDTGKYDSRPHTMTMFYMERGMGDSNLLIRYNYSTLNNFSKMKIQEVTSFEGVNPGLLDLTKKAAENDVFKYSVYNTGTDSADVKVQAKVYPDNAIRTRSNQGIDTILTTAGTGNPTTTPYNYSPPAVTNPLTEGTVANTSYIWVDDFAGMNHSTQGTGVTDSTGGYFFLMYGTEANENTQTTDMESSAEFGKQFSRYSTMRVKQVGMTGDEYLYKPTRSGNNAVTFKTSSRKVSDYYTSAVPYIFSTNDITVHNNLSGNNDTFAFRNDIGSVSATDENELVAVQMTEVFKNTVRSGQITVSKSVANETGNTEPFQFKLTLTNVYGVTDNNPTSYSNIEVNGAVDASGNAINTLAADGTFYVIPSQMVTINGIPYNTHYKVEETTSDFSHATGAGSDPLEGDLISNSTLQKNLTVVNTRLTGSLTITKNVENTPSRLSFTFDVTLTQPAGVNLSNYTIKQDGVNMSSQPQSGTSFPVTVTISGTTGSVTLSGIPYGTTYSVSEQAASQAGTVTNGVDVTYGETNTANQKIGSGTSGASHTVTVTNIYQDQVETGDLVLEKAFTENVTPSSESTTMFEYTVQLTAPTGQTFSYDSTNQILTLSGQNASLDPDTVTIESTLERFSSAPVLSNNYTVATFSVHLSQGTSRTIKNVPVDTQYVVSEVTPLPTPSGTGTAWKKITTTDPSGEIGDANAEDVAGVQTSTATIVNDLTGSLQVTKTLSNTAPGSSSSTPYEIKVTMTNPDDANFDWSKYTYSISSGGGTVSRTDNVLTISITGSGSKTISGIPYGTVCTVAETPVSNYTATVTYPNSGSSATVGSSTQTVTVDNRYTDTGSLQITKSAPNQPSGMSGETYTVMVWLQKKYNDWGDVTFNPTSAKPATDPNGAEFAVTLTNGGSLTIEGLPAGTAYTVKEVDNATDKTTLTSSTYYRGYVTSLDITQAQNGTGTVASNQANGTLSTANGLTQTVTVTNTYKQTGDLTLSKTINGAANAASDPSSDTFYFKVTLNPSVNLQSGSDTIYPITATNGTGTSMPSSTYNYTSNIIYVAVKSGANATVSGIPFDSRYTVEEVSYDSNNHTFVDNTSLDTNHPSVSVVYDGDASNANGTMSSGTNTAAVTNTYRQITITKKDKDSSVAVPNATYVLLKLEDSFLTYYNGLTTEQKAAYTLPSAYTDWKFTPSGGSEQVVYDTVVSFNDGNGGSTYNAVTDSNGQIIIKDSDVYNGSLAAGKYFFFETAAATNYNKDNSFNADKIIDLTGTNYSATDSTHYTDPYKKGFLSVTKAIDNDANATANGIAADKEYTFTVTLSNSNNNVDLSKYTLTYDTNKVTKVSDTQYSVKIKRNDANKTVTIRDIPYGTLFGVEETAGSERTSSVTYQLNSTNLGTNAVTTSTSGASIGDGTTIPVTVTNVYPATVELKLKKTVTGNAPSNKSTYPFKVTLTAPGSDDFTGYSIQVSGGTTTDTITSGTQFTVNVTPAETGNDHIVTISGLPKDTTYSVYEDSADGATSNHTSATSGANARLTGTLSSSMTDAGALTITNEFPSTGSLVLKKETDGSRPTNVPNSTPTYTFTVTLANSNVTLISGADAAAVESDTSTVGYKIYDSTNHTYIATPSSFDVVVPVDSNGVTITGIPVGTTYTVTEKSSSPNSMLGTSAVQYKINNGSWRVDNQTTAGVDESTFAGADTTGTDTVTVKNTYPSTGDLVLKKTISGTPPGGTPAASYTFHVTLTAPHDATGTSYVELNTYNITATGATLNLGTYNTSTHKYSFDIAVPYNASNNTGVRISGIPYGTTYTVEEADQASLGNPTVTYSPSKNGTIGSSNEVVINNSYLNTHKLTLSKSFHNGTTNTTSYAAKYGVGNTTRFKYHVTLSGLGTYSVNAQSVGDNNQVSTTSYTPTNGSVSFDVYVTSGQSVEITGLPDNATYSVYEDRSYGADTYLPTNVVITASGDGTGNGRSSSDQRSGSIGTGNKAVTIINTYTDTGSLTLKKSVVNRTSTEVPSATFNVTLLIPDTVDEADYNIVIDGDSSASLGTADTSVSGYKKYTFAVTVPNNSTGVVIKHLPYGTQYYVLEDSTSYPDGLHHYPDTNPTTYWVTGEVAEANKATINETTPTGSVTITNTYPQKGTLEFKKNALVNPGSITVPSTFTFEVTLTPPTGMSMLKFISEYIGVGNVAGSTDVTELQPIETLKASKFFNNGTTLSRYYTVTAGAANFTTLQDNSTNAQIYLPYGTTYTVEELDSSKDKTSNVTGEVKSADPGTIGATNQIEITNTYPNVGTLKLYKDLAAGTSATTYGNEVFYYTVTLNKPASTLVDLRDFINSTTIANLPNNTNENPARFATSGYTADTIVIENIGVKQSDASGVSIAGIPYGTSYTVSENLTTAQTNGWQKASETYGNTSNGDHLITETTASNTYKAVNAKTGTLSLVKLLEGNDVSGETNTIFEYVVVLTAPDGMTFDNASADGIEINDNTVTTGQTITCNYTGTEIANEKFAVVPTISQDGKKATITIHLSKNVPRTITGLPYGTEFTVTESANKEGWKQGSEKYGTSVQTTETIDEEQVTVTRHYIGDEPAGENQNRNSYSATNAKVASLNLTKTVNGGTNIALTFDFTVHVQLTAPSTNVDLLDYLKTTDLEDLTYVSNVCYTLADTEADPSVPSKLDFDVTLKPTTQTANNVKEISGIPYGTTYTVSESNTIGANVSYKVNNIEGDSGTIGASNDAEVINSYTTMGQLTLKKTLAGGYAQYGIVPYESDSQDPVATTFRFEVVLTPPTGILPSAMKLILDESSQWALYPTNHSISHPATGLVRTFDVPGNGQIVIGRLPYGTDYSVTELDIPSGNGCETTYIDNDRNIVDPAPVTGEIEKLTDFHTVEITNIYPGSLELKKKLVNAPFNVTDDTVFKFSVTLTKGSGDITIKENGISKTVTSGTAFNVDVSVNEPVTLTDIPIGATYTVEETATAVTPSGTGTSITGQVTTAATLTAESPTATVEITNTYAVTPKTVTLYKQDADSHEAIPNGQFYLLRLKDTTDINDPDVKNAFETGSIADGQLKMTKIVEETSTEVVLADVVTGITGAGENDVITTDTEGMILVNNITFNVGERYFFFEKTTDNGSGTTILDGTTPKTYVADNSITAEKVITINNAQDEYVVTYNNELVPTSKDVDAEKQDKDTGKSLGGAIFDLFFKKVNIPQTYTVNDPFITPMQTLTRLITGTIETPDDDVTEVTTPGTTTYTYTQQSVPSASDKDWILPRTDNDYIYFRDYNIGKPGTEDKVSFSDYAQGSVSQVQKRSWLETKLKDNVQHQSKEIDYTHNYWYAAQFSGNGKQQVQYAVWERFVDRYSGVDTVVWKIQPPDGYTQVRFLLYDGDNCIRTTEKFTFKLGTIYHKTNWGGTYKEEYGKKCYFNVPVEGEKYWSTYYGQSGSPDRRQDYDNITDKLSGSFVGTAAAEPKQADRYTPTDQKIVFHCNSTVVWHNIHIEFFDENRNPVGQTFPGYLMEPYAYAGSDYRINGYLTYELTIPKEAKYFRVNNGVDNSPTPGTFTNTSSTQSPYAFRFEYIQLHTAEDMNGRKNYGNYFKIASGYTNVTNSTAIQMTDWTSYTSTGDKWTETYKTLDVDSDYDYVYFEWPTEWGNTPRTVYAYFYGGGDLRKDNWQRATYSIWPGVAPVATEYETKNSSGTVTGTYHSDTYAYSYSDSVSHLYEGSGMNLSNPESSFIGSNGRTVYKFRIPKGDRTNYSKVIFNDGLSSQGGSHETGVITYKAGYLYYSNGGSTQHYDSKPTYSYTKRGTGDDYIYVRIANNDTTWDDMHITFHDSNGNQILQSGKGYVMEYAGTMDDGGTTYKYFRAPIPTNAAKFAVNNGKDKNEAHTKSTTQQEIFPLGTVNNTQKDYTTDRMVFTLSGTSLTVNSPTFAEGSTSGTTTVTTQDSHADYVVRGSADSPSRTDTLYIRDEAGWNIVKTDGKIRFYDQNGDLITGTGTDGNGTYTLIKTVAEDPAPADGAKVWYKITIPKNAKTFTIFYHSSTTHAPVTTQTYDIFPYDADATEGSYTTTGNMYYKTESGGRTLSLLESVGTTTIVPAATPYAAPSYVSSGTRDGSGGDYLYLVCSDKSQWTDMKVTFNDENGAPMAFTQGGSTTTAIAPEYLNYVAYDPVSPVDGVSTSDPNAAGYWFRLAIPAGAKTFTVTGTDTANSSSRNTTSAAIYELRSADESSSLSRPSRYDKDWTTGDMQYRLPDSGTVPTLLYPVFTEDDVATMEAGGQTVYDYVSSTVADESAITDYAGADSAKQPTHSVSEPSNPKPVLYDTSKSEISYTWEEAGGSGGSIVYFDNSMTGWSTVYIFFQDSASPSTNTGWGTYEMHAPAAGDTYWWFDLSTILSSDTNYPNFNTVAFHNFVTGSGEETVKAQFNGGALYTPNIQSTNYLYLYHPDSNKPNTQAKFKNLENSITSNLIGGNDWNTNPNGGNGGGGDGCFKWDIPNTVERDNLQGKTADQVDFYINGVSNSGFMGLTNGGRGRVYEYANGSYSLKGYKLAESPWISSELDSNPGNKIDLIRDPDYSGGTATYTAAYQPEDRYTLITDTAENGGNGANGTSGTNDSNNFITINTDLDDPHIIFYTDTTGTNAINGVDENDNPSNGIALAYAEVNGSTVTTPTSPYKIRLPKNARSFKITGKNSSDAPITSALQQLYETVDVIVDEGTNKGQPYSGGDDSHVAVTNFHHAGSTFTFNASAGNGGAVTVTSLRSGYTISKSEMTDPLNPKSDDDYIFFTDTTGSFASGNKVYAYYYGSVDGEYKAWPGIVATAASEAPTTYTDNNGKKVYKFRVPKDGEGTYTKVIFTNGGTTENDRKITKAADLEAGKNYLLGGVSMTTAATPAQVVYDTRFAQGGKVYDVTPTAKADGTTKNYLNTKNRYIYIVNNGTQNLTGETVATGANSRFTLDEMHVVFYDQNNNAIGTNTTGYLPDKLGAYSGSTWTAKVYEGHDVYRISVPDNAKYFQINNGINKGLDENQEDTHLNERYSKITEIADNGLYKFVEGESTASKYIQTGDTLPATENDRYKPKYLLDLINPFTSGEEPRPITIDEIWLATVVTDDADTNKGKIKYIQDLKAEGVDTGVVANPTLGVDREYLDHTRNDVGEEAGKKKVKVLQKGTYYWKEKSAPSGYKLNTDTFEFVYDDDGKVYARNEDGFLVDVTNTSPTVVIKNEEEDTPKGEVILTKTAKEKVGTTDIGDVLAGAQFKLVNVNDPTTEIKLKKTTPNPEGAVTGKTTNEYRVDNSGTYNTGTSYPETGEDGRLHIKGLPVGDYYLEEQKAPAGYSEKDLTGAKRRVYFSVGENREVKEISASDEMAPAYIRIFEHINDFKPDEWGNPTFIFKIKQTGYDTYDVNGDYNNTVTINNGKEMVVSLTFNGTTSTEEKITGTIKYYSLNGTVLESHNFSGDPVDSANNTSLYTDWFVEGTTESEYEGMFHIDEQGRIRVEPGSYLITRVPVSRYEFVTSGHVVYDPENSATAPGTLTSINGTGTEAAEVFEVRKNQIADVHYYDKIAYYDKFTQVDEEINKFYTLNINKQNTTIKGIRIADYQQKGNVTNGDTDASDVMTVKVADLEIYKIMSDGSEVAMSKAEKNELTGTNFTVSYTAQEGDFADFAVAAKGFSYDNSDEAEEHPETYPQIVINKAFDYQKGVYTLKADYNGFKTSFDIVFLREATTP